MDGDGHDLAVFVDLEDPLLAEAFVVGPHPPEDMAFGCFSGAIQSSGSIARLPNHTAARPSFHRTMADWPQIES